MSAAAAGGPPRGGDDGEDHESSDPVHKTANTFHGEDHEEGEPWLLSYADMVTLLMCFFILFFSIDKSKGGIDNPDRLRKRLQRALALDPATLATPSAAESTKGERSEKGSATARKLEETKKGLQSQLYQVSKELKVVFALSQPDPETLSLTFLSSSFFTPGAAELTSEAKTTLAQVAERIKGITKDGLRLEIDGHTDSDPVTNGRYPSNWELSSARAAAVARALIDRGIEASAVQISGFADQRPVVQERDSRGISAGMAKKMNRRVEIKLKLANAPPTAPAAPVPTATHETR